MSADKRTQRDERRRSLGQNFLQPERAEQLVDSAALVAGDLVVEIGAGRGALTYALAARGVQVVALEKDPHWADALRREVVRRGLDGLVRVVRCDALAYRMPRRPFRVIGSLPFGATTPILRHLLDDPESRLERADVIVQWEVARKRAIMPPSTLLSTTWAPWWSFEVVERIPAAAFRPVPSVDAAVLCVTRRDPPLLPPRMAVPFASFVRHQWQ
ncbi:MAG TPA: rRNA adenine N(6)-methyltransferase family protein [Acidimicrobiales bacterium]|nr:rRNA adenine N(6)-methyltransferase family protein [Acidimicrobiales bacterium]